MNQRLRNAHRMQGDLQAPPLVSLPVFPTEPAVIIAPAMPGVLLGDYPASGRIVAGRHGAVRG